MSITSYRSYIGSEDVNWWDGGQRTFTRSTSTGGSITMTAVGNDVDVYRVRGARAAGDINAVLGTIGTARATIALDPATWSIDANVTIPANAALDVSAGANITVSNGVTLTINGGLKMPPMQQAFTLVGTGKVIFGNLAKQRVIPHWFDDADPWNGFALAAAALAAGTGGGVFFPLVKYRMNKTVQVSSNYRINLWSHMGHLSIAGGAVQGVAYFAPTADLGATDACIEYVAPTASRGAAGGGNIRGLAFIDDTNLSAATALDRRAIAFGSVFQFTDWDMSELKECQFLELAASAIKTERAIQSSVDAWVMHCGDTGKPAVYIKGNVDGANIAQSFHINGRIEHNFNAAYVSISQYDLDCYVDGQFEALNAVQDPTGASNQYFIDTAGARTHLGAAGLGLNKNQALKINVQATAINSILGTVTSAGDNTLGVLAWAGTFGTIGLLSMAGAASNVTNAVVVSGANATIGEIAQVSGGRIVISGADTTVGAIMAYNAYTTEAEVVLISGARASLNGGSINTTNTAGVNGVNITGSNAKCRGVAFANITGTGVVVGVGGVVVSGNTLPASVTTKMSGYDSYANVIVEDNVGFVTKATGTATITAAATSVVVTHGLAITPTNIQLTFNGDPGTSAKCWYSSPGATQFTINVDAAPGASIGVRWHASRVMN